jgi:isopentenyl-diphosphate delta-isomerase
MTNDQYVILVDEKDHPKGTMEKMEAHEKGLLHRAFSVFIFNRRGDMLLQRRALKKYHSGGLWTNACCSHPNPDEDVHHAAVRRLKEELGFETILQKAFEFTYRSEYSNGLTENEFDHVFTGEYNGAIQADPKEVSDYCYKSIEDIRQSLSTNPEKFTTWFHIAFPKIENWWNEYYKHELA